MKQQHDDTDYGEIARIKKLQKQRREAERLKFANPDAEPELEWIWVAHVWIPNDPADPSVGEWSFAGFRRRRNRRKPQSMNGFFSKVRRKFGIDKKSPVVMRDLQSVVRLIRGKDQSWRTRPPQFQARKAKPKQIQPTVISVRPKGKAAKRRAPKKAFKLDRRTTKFIALGRNAWDRKPGYLYCGPLEADYRSDAVREADRLFKGTHGDILIVKTSDLSKPMRNRMHSGKKVKAGVARIIWPEPIPEFDPLWAKLVRTGKAEDMDSAQCAQVHEMWINAGSPWLTLGWLRKAIKKVTPSTGDVQCAKKKGKKKSKAKRGSASVKAKPIAKRATTKSIAPSRALRGKRDVKVLTRPKRLSSTTRRRPAAMRAA